MSGQAKSIKQEWTSNGLDPKRFDEKLLPRTKEVLGGLEDRVTTVNPFQAELDRRKKERKP
jgi:hypothetical protein